MTFEKPNIHVRYMKWIPISFLMTIYNDKMSQSLCRKPQANKESQFECLFSKFNRNFKKTLSHECVLMVVSDTFGLLFVDFVKEGIIKMEMPHQYILSLDLICRTNGSVKHTLIAHGNKSGVVEFNYCDSDLNEASHQFQKAHTGSVSCIQFSKIVDGKLKCATGSYDRYINLYRINNFTSKDFTISKDIVLYAKLKHKYRITQVDFSIHDYDKLLNVCDKHATVQIWDAGFEEKSERRLFNIRGHRGFISSAAFSLQAPNTVISGSDDQTVKVWNLLEIKNSKPPNKKKQRLNRHDDEDDEEEEEDEEEKQEELVHHDKGDDKFELNR